jgi:hypothetical protein
MAQPTLGAGTMAHGQGKPLPAFMKLNGEWIIENVVFLYHAEYSSQPPTATFVLKGQRQDGSHALGFDWSQLAGAFSIEVPALMEANKNHTLVFVGDKDVAPSHGGVSAIAFIFQIGDRQATLIIETDANQQEGTA